MYIVKQDNQTLQELSNKENLYLFLKAEYGKVMAAGQLIEFTVMQTDSDGTVFHSYPIQLPQDDIDEFIERFLESEKKLKKSKQAERSERDFKTSSIQLRDSSRQDKQKTPIRAMLFSLVMVSACVGMAGFFTFQTVGSNQKIQSLTKELTAVKSQLSNVAALQEEEHTVDLFARYFIPHYFSGNPDNIKAYTNQPIEVREGKVQSVLLEKISTKKGKIKAVYVVGVRADGGVSNIRLEIPLEKSKDSRLLYRLAGEPKELPYP